MCVTGYLMLEIGLQGTGCHLGFGASPHSPSIELLCSGVSNFY